MGMRLSVSLKGVSTMLMVGYGGGFGWGSMKKGGRVEDIFLGWEVSAKLGKGTALGLISLTHTSVNSPAAWQGPHLRHAVQ